MRLQSKNIEICHKTTLCRCLDWITDIDQYHAKHRWEWTEVIKLLSARQGVETVLELGCGVGTFLPLLDELPTLTVSGIDASAASVEKAKARGLNVRCQTVEEVAATDQRYDVVVLSHVLEHVSDPIELMQSIASILQPGGWIMCSLPYSPMSREMPEFGVWDPMNLPPHHITRWNAQSFKALADRLGMEVVLYTSIPKSVLKRAFQATVRSCGVRSGSAQSVLTALQNAGRFKYALTHFASRGIVNGRRAGDTALAVFRS
jgi:2-polyprenyl-3-methyl-5-hydroxy-6-metoxy-1,4-benzoquinol methylase